MQHQTSRRKQFLEIFLGALGAFQIVWTHTDVDKICGTVVYDPNHTDEKQDFVWHMQEENVPSNDVERLLQYLTSNNLIDSDKITIPVDELHVDFLDQPKQIMLFNELFNVQVHMIDDGVETDTYFIHN